MRRNQISSFAQNGRVCLNRQRTSVQSTTGSRDVGISGSNAEYTMFRGSVKSTGYPLHSPLSPSFPLSCITVCHHISTGVYVFYSAPSVLVPTRVLDRLELQGGARYVLPFYNSIKIVTS